MIVFLCFIIQGDDLTAATTRETLALPDPYEHEAPRKITDEEREFSAYKTLREQRGFARNEGKRKLRAAKVRQFYFSTLEVADWEPNDRKRKRRPTRRSKGPPIPFLTVVVLLLYTLSPYTSLRRIAPVLLSHFVLICPYCGQSYQNACMGLSCVSIHELLCHAKHALYEHALL